MINDIKELCSQIGYKNIKKIEKLTGGLLHKMYKVETQENDIVVKILNKEIMSRKEALNNFNRSEIISNYIKDNNINVSNAIKINDEFIIRYNDNYYMIFNYIKGNVLNDKNITINHCKKIANEIGKIHSLNYEKLNIKNKVSKVENNIDLKKYIKCDLFDSMPYKKLYLDNYQKYESILKRVIERYNLSENEYSLCHLDLDPKNVMWEDDTPIIIDWECADISNPNKELLEVALNWSGFLSDTFDEEKFKVFFTEYKKYKDISNVDWYDTICGNLITRFNWLDYNLKRSLEFKTIDLEENEISKNEVIKTINEINRYLELIGKMDEIISSVVYKNIDKYENVIKKIIQTCNLINRKDYKLINSGFTNTIYKIENYIVKICTNIKNEENFKKEVEFYKNNLNNKYIPKLYYYDLSKKEVEYFYEIIECVDGVPLYEVWYKMSNNKKKETIQNIIKILNSFNNKEEKEYNFLEEIKTTIQSLGNECKIDDNKIKSLLEICSIIFKENNFKTIHGDLHFDNIIYNKDNVKLIDFERVKYAPLDYELKIISMYKIYPYFWASSKSDMLTVEYDYKDIIDDFINNYKDLKNIKYIKERIEVYSIIELLHNYKNTKEKDRLELINEKTTKLIERTK